MFTQTFTRTIAQRVLSSDLLDLLTGPHGVDRYTELVTPTWTSGEARAKVVDVRRTTPRSVTLTLTPNAAFTDRHAVKAGQFVNVTVEIDGRTHSRCYSPANVEGSLQLELTIGQHDGGLVSTYLYERARRGMVVGLDGVGGDFVLPAPGADGRPRRILFVTRVPLRKRAIAMSSLRCAGFGCCTATPDRTTATWSAASERST
jgi:hypothetical protein